MSCQVDSRSPRLARLSLLAGAVSLLAASATVQAEQVIKPYFLTKKPKMITIDGDLSTDTNGAAAPKFFTSGPIRSMFEGISQYDGASFGRNFIPPDTNGAVGASQYMEVSNGAYAVFDKATGTRTALMSDVNFWAGAGQTGASGDSRVMYNADAGRWIVSSFGANVKDLQIAISDTSDAMGSWKSVKFEGYAGLPGVGGGVADYPTLALDRNAVYIGTNNFAPSTPGGGYQFRGTTLNVIPMNSLFGAGAPSVANFKQFVTPYTGSGGDVDRGYALQGVNSSSAGSSGTVLAASLFEWDNVGFKVNGLNASSAAGASLSTSVYTNMSPFVAAGPGRQPSAAIAANRRVIDTLDDRLSSSVYESNGRIYAVKTVDTGSDYARIRYTVLDADTFAILSEGEIGQAGYDYYEGSIAVNADGRVVIGYNRSGLDEATGKISFMAQTFKTLSDGSLAAVSGELLLKESLTDDYHNGSLFGSPAAGRQRWGDYSQVSIDPNDPNTFWLIGEFAREYNLPEFGHPGGTGGSRWGTWIASVSAVPEPSTWMMMIAGFAAVGCMARRRSSGQSAASQAA